MKTNCNPIGINIEIFSLSDCENELEVRVSLISVYHKFLGYNITCCMEKGKSNKKFHFAEDKTLRVIL